MDFITLEDCKDEIVTCAESDITEANSYLLNLSKQMNVSESKIVIPAVYTVKRLGVVYALYIACIRNIGKDNLTSLDTESVRMDIYAQKARLYKQELAEILKGISEADFTGKASGYGTGFIVPVWRA